MLELLNTATSHVNIVLTFFLVFSILYWLLMIIGLVDLESIDFDLDADLDLELDADVDVDTEMDMEVESDLPSTISTQIDGLGEKITDKKKIRKWYFGPLNFFGVGTIPLMIITSFLVLSMWAISIVLTQKFSIQSWPLGMLSLIPSFLGGLFVTKIISSPLYPIFKKMREGQAKSIEFVGKTCKIDLATDNSSLGQASVFLNGDIIKINVKSTDQKLDKGDQGLIVEEIKDKNYYIIEKINNL